MSLNAGSQLCYSILKEARRVYLPLYCQESLEVVGEIALEACSEGGVLIKEARVKGNGRLLAGETLCAVFERTTEAQSLVSEITGGLVEGNKLHNKSIDCRNGVNFTVADKPEGTAQPKQRSFVKKCLTTTVQFNSHFSDSPHLTNMDGVISLGSDCTMTQALKLRDLRPSRSLPFDWLRIVGTRNLTEVLQAEPFEKDNVKNLKWIQRNEFAESPEGTHLYDHTHGLISSHHGTEDPSEQFKRRFDRMADGLSRAKRVLFVTSSRHPDHPITISGVPIPDPPDPLLLDTLGDVVHSLYPHLSFAILAFNYGAKPGQPQRWFANHEIGWSGLRDQSEVLAAVLPEISLSSFEW
eukprot:TRINITY_DN27230_c0_g1_i1.p1 TRINITY_DN27230_c0_g1~~TRINITY_DN27230_c0_g1_i1.p1  ORF type:complete len:366 (+),score=56.43 TRINITY_DN27230_c0_g1_i1:42-1100(+)